MNGLKTAVMLNTAEICGSGKDHDIPVDHGGTYRTPGMNLTMPRRPACSEKVQRTILLIDERQLTLECFASSLERKITDMLIATCPSVNGLAQQSELNWANVTLLLLNIGPRRIGDPKSVDELSTFQEQLPNVPILVISDHEETQQIVDALECVFRGYIPTSTAVEVVIGAIRLVQAGGIFIPASALTARWREQGLRLPLSGTVPDTAAKDFTNRQMQVLVCLREGMPNKVIAHELEMCESTVKVHVRHIMKKLCATNRTQVVYLTNNLFAAK